MSPFTNHMHLSKKKTPMPFQTYFAVSTEPVVSFPCEPFRRQSREENPRFHVVCRKSRLLRGF